MGWIAKDLKKFDNIAGIQVVNEAEFSDPAKKQSTYYAACITEIRKSDSWFQLLFLMVGGLTNGLNGSKRNKDPMVTLALF